MEISLKNHGQCSFKQVIIPQKAVIHDYSTKSVEIMWADAFKKGIQPTIDQQSHNSNSNVNPVTLDISLKVYK